MNRFYHKVVERYKGTTDLLDVDQDEHFSAIEITLDGDQAALIPMDVWSKEVTEQIAQAVEKGLRMAADNYELYSERATT